MSSYELAKRDGMAQSSLYNMFERGTMPKIETLDRLCKGMGIDMSDFFVVWSKPRAGGYLTEKIRFFRLTPEYIACLIIGKLFPESKPMDC